MKHLKALTIIILCLCIKLFANDIILPDSKLTLNQLYHISKNDIYAKDIFPQLDRNFKVASFAPDKFVLRMKTSDLKLLFKRNGYSVDGEFSVVEFRYINDMRDFEAYEFIKKMYIKHYGENLVIKSLLVKRLNDLPPSFDFLGFELAQTMLKKQSGNFMMKYHTPNDKHTKRATFSYLMNASLQVFKASRDIASNELIDTSNTKLESISFERTLGDYILSSDINNSSAKAYIRANTAITKDKIKPKIIVKKGDDIRVISTELGISAEIILQALQNATYNDIINAKNPQSGKVIRVRVIDVGKGEML